jgi:phospholipase C
MADRSIVDSFSWSSSAGHLNAVMLMQENRSFDHYFGTLSGVRGFSDPRPLRLPSGRPVFYQPDPTNPDGFLLPYRLNSLTTAAQAIPSMSHEWAVQHQALNGGAMDDWLPAHVASDGASVGPFTMGYFTREDIPFQYALADAFTICDSYHCSVLGPTGPNRHMWMAGTIDPNGLAGGPSLTTSAPNGAYSFTTYPERLEAAGVSWKGPYNLAQFETAQFPLPAFPTTSQSMPRQERGHRPHVQ